MIDTGFTGFLSIPLTAAFPLALTLFGTASYELADGSVSPKLLAWGHVELEDEDATGIILLESKSKGLLVGMEFLTKLNKALFVGKDTVWLVDQSTIDAASPTTIPTEPTVESAPAAEASSEPQPQIANGEENE